MVDWLLIWGVTATFVFRPILEELAKDVAKDAAKSYVRECFKSVFSGISRDPLSKATGLAVYNLLKLFESELIRADIKDEEVAKWTDDIRNFIAHENVKQSFSSLFLDPDYYLDPEQYAAAWQSIKTDHELPDGFSWQFICRRLSSAITEIRISHKEIQSTFDSAKRTQDSNALRELAGLPPDFDLEAYREAVIERYGSLDFSCLDSTGSYYNGVRLWNVFVPQSVREFQDCDPKLLEVPKEVLQEISNQKSTIGRKLAHREKIRFQRQISYVNQVPRPVLEVIDDRRIQRLTLLGDPGSGKSSLLRFVALRWANIEDPNLRYRQPIPLVIELRSYSRWICDSGKSFLKYLHEASTWHRLNQQTLVHLLDKPDRIVLLLDGLDEVFEPEERERVLNDIQRFSNRHKLVRVIVTSRIVGYQPYRLKNAEFQHFMLQDLTSLQVRNFLEKWHSVTYENSADGNAKRIRLENSIGRYESIEQLAGNPLLLTMMAILNRHQELPKDRVDLYQQCSRLLLHQWDIERALGDFPGLSSEIGLREKSDLLGRIAYFMQTNSLGKSRSNNIEGATLELLIEKYLREQLHFDKAKGAARALVEQLRVRNFILCFLGDDEYAFVHRTFLEYFCANEIVFRYNVSKKMGATDLGNLFKSHCRDDDWREVLRLICSQINDDFVGDIIEEFVKRIDFDLWDGEAPLPELRLSIDLLSEVRAVNRLEQSGAKLLSAILECFFRGKPKLQPFISQIVSSADEIGTRWPGAKNVKWESCDEPFFHVEHYRWIWPYLLLTFHREREAIEGLTESVCWRIRGASVLALVNEWPSPATRDKVYSLSQTDPHDFVRGLSLRALASQWPEKYRQHFEERAVKDEHWYVRGVAAEILATHWNDDESRKYIVALGESDRSEFVRAQVADVLAKVWHDENTRTFLLDRMDKDESDYVAANCVTRLGKAWPNDITRNVILSKASNAESSRVRIEALEILAEKWRDVDVENFLFERYEVDEDDEVKAKAIKILSEKWPSERLRDVLVRNKDEGLSNELKVAVLSQLAEKWSDEKNRRLLERSAVRDSEEEVRAGVIGGLVRVWPDQRTRSLLEQIATNDSASYVRLSAIEAIGENWPDSHSLEFVKNRADVDESPVTRGYALCCMYKAWQDRTVHEALINRISRSENEIERSIAFFGLCQIHSTFGGILASVDLDGEAPFIDPVDGISHEHLKNAIAISGLPETKVDFMVRSLEKHLGWNLCAGTGKS